MRYNTWSRILSGYLVITLAIALAAYFIWDGVQNPGGGKICAGLGLLAFAGAFISIKRFDDKTELITSRRIKAEFPAQEQPQVYELYQQLKTKNLGDLFTKVLDDAHGDLGKAKKLTGLAETVEWKEFLDNH